MSTLFMVHIGPGEIVMRKSHLFGGALLAVVFALALSLSSTARAADEGAKKDIVDTAMGADNFKTLVAAIKAAGLVDTLKGAGPFTVFAPTDDAFAKLPAGTLDDLLKPENKA